MVFEGLFVWILQRECLGLMTAAASEGARCRILALLIFSQQPSGQVHIVPVKGAETEWIARFPGFCPSAEMQHHRIFHDPGFVCLTKGGCFVCTAHADVVIPSFPLIREERNRVSPYELGG